MYLSWIRSPAALKMNGKLEKFKESDIFQVSEIFPAVLSVFWYRCFCKIQTLFSVVFYIRRKVILSSIWRYDYFVCRVNKFRVMVDFVRDPNKFQIL